MEVKIVKIHFQKNRNIFQESIRCIYCKNFLNEQASDFELAHQVHLSCKRELDGFNKKSVTLPKEVFKEIHNFFKEFDITQYRYLTNKELFARQRLNLNDKKITYLPESIRFLSNVKALGLGGNNLIDLPEELGLMHNLEMINLSGNKFQEIPTIIEKLTNLKQIVYAGNNVNRIPEIFFMFNQLTELDMSFNRLKEIPSTIEQMKTLEKLYLSYNSIGKIPDPVKKLRNLRILDVSHNQLVELPHWIGEKHYTIINLTHNPIENLESKLQSLQALMLNCVVI